MPLALLATPTIIFAALTRVGVSSSTFANMLMDFGALTLLINPLVTVICIRPYRRTLVNMVRQTVGSKSIFLESSESVFYVRRNTVCRTI